MKIRIFQNYHRHTCLTNPKVPDSVVQNRDYAVRAKDLGHGIISSCEHGYQGRYIETFELHNEFDLKFLFSSEAYWVWDRTQQDGTNCHIFLGAKNENGRQAINDIISEANITGFYRQARVDPGLILSLPKDDVIVTTACIAFWRYDGVEDFVEKLWQHFGKSFFLEVQNHNTDSQRELNKRILGIHNRLKIPLIMGCDSHYIDTHGAQLRTDFLYSKGMEYPDEDGWYMDYPDGETAWRRFKEQGVLSESDIADAMDNTNVFLDVEEYDCPCFNEEIKCPSLYPNYTQDQKNQEYEKLVWQGWGDYQEDVPIDQWDHYEEEIQKEIDVVEATGTADYFIDDYYIIKKGIENGGVITSSGRGSGVSFFTNKLLGFTEVDRISAPVKMYPERFMSATRILQAKTLPDLDINVADQEPFALAQKQILGDDHAYPMIAYGTYKTSAAWKLYAKSQGIDFDTSNEVSRQLKHYEEVVKLADEDSKDSISVYDYVDPKFREVYEHSKIYQGIIDSWSIAPCSYLLYQGSIRKEIGLVRIKGRLCCLMDGHWAEKYKFLKNDLLKVKVVDVIDRTFKRIGIPRLTVRELLERCPPEDKVWDIYKRGCTIGINQVEQAGTSSRVGKYGPTNISELCAFVAAIRPGFKSMYKRFESREPFSYNIKSLDDLIRTPDFPQSYILYQEMSMAVLNYAGIDMGECYTIIKNIAKKRVDKVLSYKEQFLDGMEKRLIEAEHLLENEAREVAENIWQILEDSSRYAFNACLSGDTRLFRKARGNEQMRQKDLEYTIEQMYNVANDMTYKAVAGHMAARNRYHIQGYGTGYSLFGDGNIYVNDIVGIFPAGRAKLYRVITENGCWVKCTEKHKLMTPEGLKSLYYIRPGTMLVTMKHVGWEEANNRLGFQKEFSPVLHIEELGEEDVYDVAMRGPAYNFLHESGLIVGNSHSYCVAIDSLYGAWLKTYYPMEFYESYLRIQEESGDKDKFNAAKEEAEKYFKIRFAPFRFGQDNRSIMAHPESKTMTVSLSSIKGFGRDIGELMYELGQKEYSNFTDILLQLSSMSIGLPRVKPLIKIDYFEKFGNSRELLRIAEMFYGVFKEGAVKSIKKSSIEDPKLEEMIARHGNGNKKDGTPAASYKITDPLGLMYECEQEIKAIGIEDFDIKLKIQAQNEILGDFMPTGKEEDRPMLVVQDIRPLRRKDDGEQFGYSFFCKSIGSGIQTRFTVVNGVINKCGMPNKQGIIYCTKRPKSNKGFFRMEEYTIVR